MPREKELFRDNLERLDADFPNKEMLTQKDVSKFTGIGEWTVPKHFKNRTRKGAELMKTNIALIIMALLCLFSVRMTLQVNECKSELIEVKQTAEIISVQQNATDERIKAIEISKPNVTTQQADTPYLRDIPLSDELQSYTYEIATEYGVNYDLMLAIMQTESQYQNVISDNGEDIGLCQINSVNAEWLYEEYGINNLMDERQNIEACAIILDKLQGQFDDESHVVMAYNLGAGKAERYIEKGKLTEYTEKVYKNKGEIEK